MSEDKIREIKEYVTVERRCGRDMGASNIFISFFFFFSNVRGSITKSIPIQTQFTLKIN